MSSTTSPALAEWESGLLAMQVDINAIALHHLNEAQEDHEVAQEILDRAFVFDMIATDSRMPLSSHARMQMHQNYFNAAKMLHDRYGALVEV